MQLVRLFLVCTALIGLSSACEAQVASLSTSDSTIMPDRRTVLIQKANVPADGLVIVRAVRNGTIEPVSLGQARLRPGETENLRVNLARPARGGEALVVMLHADYGRMGVYDRTDPVVLSVDIAASVVNGAPNRP